MLSQYFMNSCDPAVLPPGIAQCPYILNRHYLMQQAVAACQLNIILKSIIYSFYKSWHNVGICVS